jgi:hypothetical protein
MLYKRSSFIKWLTEVKECEVFPIRDTNVLIIKNWQISIKIMLDKKDRIDYEEIWLICNKLYIVGLPGDNELERIE